MISINKYGQNIDLSKIVAVNGTKSISLDGLTLNETLIINVTKGMKFQSSLEENDLKIEFTDIDGSIFEVILKDMATLLAENDGEKLVEIVQTDDNKVLASITDITTALAAAAAGAEAPGAGNNGTNSDSAANNDGFADGLNITPNLYDNATLPASINLAAALPVDETRRNFAPTIETIAPQSVDEDNSLLINYIATDANNDALTATVTATNGTAVITEAGQILFTPNANFNGAAEIVLTITDGLLTTIQTIAITVNPVNDVPTISADATTVIEDAAALLTTGGTITVVDVDANESFVTPQTNVAGLYGTFNIAANGVWTYSADNTQSAIQALGEIETLTETFAVTSLDGTATSNVVVTIQGTNDTPIILEQVNSLYEDTILNGQLISSDVDTALIDLKYSTSSTIEGFVLNEDGSYSFDANNYDYLAAGETLNLSIPIIVTDDFAATASSFLNITLTGTNDRPVIQNIDANGTSTVASSGGGTTTTPDPDLIIGRSAEVDGEVFLGGKFIELGIHSSGSFGTSGSRPAGFYGTDSDSRLGMTSDSDGFDEGNDLRIDYFLPGSPEEAWNLGYKIGGSTFVGTNAGLEGESEIPFSVTNTTSGNTLSASGTGVFNATLQTNMSISFDANADYYKTTIVLTNNSASTIDDVRYMKSFDPDNTVYLGGDYTTINKIESTFEAGDGKAIVSATSLAGDNYNTLSGEQSKIFLFSDDSRAKVTTYGFSLRDVYDSNVYDNTLSKGSVVTDDIAISIAFDVGTLAPGESVTISYYTGLTNRDITTVIDEIETRKVIYETHDLRTDLLIDDLNQDSTNSTYEGKISISDLDTNDLDLHTLSILKDAAGKNIIDITGPKDSSGNDIITADDITVNVSRNPDNTWNYSIEGNFTALKEGEELTLKFQYVADDTRGFDGTDGINESSISETKEIKLTITGTNDRPVVSDISSSITETGNEVLTTFESTLNVSDDDINDTHTFHLVAGTVTLDGVSVADTFVSVYLDSATSEWKYKVEGDFNYLSKDEITTLEFKYYAQDDSSGLGESNKTVAKTVTLTVIGTNDAPTVVATPLAMTSSEDAFATYQGVANGYKVYTEAEIFKLMGVKDVDSYDMTIELVPNSASFIVTDPNETAPIDITNEVDSENTILNNVVRLTQAYIDENGITGAEEGDFLVYSKQLNQLTTGDSLAITFGVVANDGALDSGTSTITINVSGVNDAPTVVATPLAMTSSEDAFATYQGVANGYKVYTEAEIFKLMGVKDVDSYDMTIELVPNSASFIVTDPNETAPIDITNEVDSENTILNNVVRLTQAYIDENGITGAEEGDFLVYSKQLNQLTTGDSLAITFGVVANDGLLNSGTSTITINVSGVNDAPTVVATPLAMTSSEDAFATYQGVANGYKVYTEAEIFKLMGVKDVDSYDMTIELVPNSASFIVTDPNETAPIDITNEVDSENTILNNVVRLTQAYIDENGITGAEEGDFLVYSKQLNQLTTGDSLAITFGVVANDGLLNSGTSTITINVSGVNDAPTVTATPLAMTSSEDAFATYQGVANGYTVYTEAEIFKLMGVKDVDSYDMTIELVPNSASFIVTDPNETAPIDITNEVDSENTILNNVVRLTQAYIDENGITGAEEGDFLVYSKQLNQLTTGDSLAITFGVVANDGLLNSGTSTITINVSGVNDAPTVTATPLAMTSSEDAFATYQGVANGYTVYTEAEIFKLMGVKDVDSYDMTIELVPNSASFIVTDPNETAPIDITNEVDSENTILNNVVRLTQAYIDENGITGAEEGDFLVYSKQLNQLTTGDSLAITFGVVANDGALDSGTSTITINVSGVNDAPTVVATPLAMTSSEDAFATYQGVANGYTVYTEAEIFKLMGVKDVDSYDMTIELVPNSASFIVTDPNETAPIDITNEVDSENTILNNVVRLTQAYIDENGITGAEEGDFLVYSKQLNQLTTGDSLAITFGVVANDGLLNSGTSTITINVSGVNDAPTVTATPLAMTSSEDAFATYQGVANGYTVYTEAEIFKLMGVKDVDSYDMTIELVPNSASFIVTDPNETAPIDITNEVDSENTILNNVVRLTQAYIDENGITGAEEGDFLVYSKQLNQLTTGDSLAITFGVVANDGLLNSGTSTITINVSGVNDAPTVVATPLAMTSSEDAFATYQGVANGYKVYTEAEIFKLMGVKDVDSYDMTIELVPNSASFIVTDPNETAPIDITNEVDSENTILNNVVRLTQAYIDENGITGAEEGDFLVYSKQLNQLTTGDSLAITFGVVANDGLLNSGTSTITINVSGVNDAPTVTATPLAMTSSEDAFATYQGVANGYTVYTEAEIFKLMGVKDVDSYDMTIELVPNSASFIVTDPNETAPIDITNEVDSENTILNNVVRLTQAYIDENGITGAEEGDFLVYSKQLNQLTTGDSLAITFGVVANDGLLNSGTSTITINVSGVNDAPTVVATPLAMTSSEDAFATYQGVANGYKVYTEAEIFKLMGVKDVDSYDMTIELVPNSASFIVTDPNETAPIDITNEVDSENTILNNVVRLTQAYIDENGITGAEEGDFLVYSKQLNQLTTGDSLAITFGVVANDGLLNSGTSTITINVSGVNDAPTVVATPLAMTSSEDAFATYQGVANGYKVYTEAEIFKLMGVKDVDSYDMTIELVPNSASFIVTDPNETAPIDITNEVDSENTILNNVVRLTQAYIDENGITGAEEGDFLVYSKQLNQLTTGDSLAITFGVVANDGLLNSGTSTITINVSGVNDAPTVVATPLAMTSSEDAFATYQGVANGYKVYTEAEIFKLMGVKDVDSYDMTIELVPNSASFIVTDPNETAPIDITNEVDSENTILNNVVRLTQAYIDENGITGAEEGDFLVYSKQLNQLTTGDSLAITFGVVANDGLLNSGTSTITINVSGVNDAPTVVATPLAMTSSEDAFATYQGVANGYKVYTEAEIFKLMGVKDVDSYDMTIELVPNSASFIVTDPNETAPIDITNEVDSENTILNNVVRLTQAYIDENGITGAEEGDFLVYSKQLNQLTTGDSLAITFGVVANDGALDSGTSTITINVSGVNDAPTVVATPLAMTSSEDAFATYQGVANGYKVYTEAEIFKLMGVKDVDSYDMTIELVPNSASFIVTDPNETAPIDITNEVDSENTILNNVVRLTQAYIDENGITGAEEGDFLVYSKELNQLTTGDSLAITFGVVANDGALNSGTSTITINVSGVNDAPVATASATIVANDVSYVGQLVASDTDLNDTLTYTYDNSSVSMTLTVDGLNNLDTLMALNNASTLSALTELKAAAISFADTTPNLAVLLTLSASTIAIGKTAVSTLLNFLNTNSGLGDIKDFIVDNRDVIIANTELSSDDITLIQGLLTTDNISALNSLFTTYETLMSTPSVQAAVQAILYDNVISSAELSALSSNTTVQAFVANAQSLLAANTAILSLIDIPTIVSKLQSIIAVDEVNGEVSVTAEIPSTTADVMIALDATTGEYTVTNPYLATLPDNTQVEVKFDYTVTDLAGASDDSTAAIMITSENVDKVSASLDDDGILVMGDEKDIDMASLLSNITSNINVADIDSIDLSSNEHILSNLTIADFQEMVSDSSANTLEIKGENNDIIKLDPAIWLKDTSDTDTNSVVDNADDNFISYKATTTDSQVLTLLIDKDIIVQDI